MATPQPPTDVVNVNVNVHHVTKGRIEIQVRIIHHTPPGCCPQLSAAIPGVLPTDDSPIPSSQSPHHPAPCYTIVTARLIPNLNSLNT